MKRIFPILIAVVIVAVLGVVLFAHRTKTRTQNNGEVDEANVASDKSAVAPDSPAPAAAAPGNQPDATQAPAADTIQRNPPNGTVFAGKGKFQLYRQGDITWRLNTDNGAACILFATDTQWSKPSVYQHGCGPV